MLKIFTPPDAEIAVIVGAAVLVVLMAQAVPVVYFLAYPIRFFITIVHELGHGLAALATGGQFSHFELRGDTSGVAWSRGGWPFVIISAGYLGTALLNTVLIIFTGIRGAAPFVLAGTGLFVILLVLLFGWTSLTTVLGGLGSGLGLILIAWFGREGWSLFFISLLAILGSLEAVTDLRYLARIAQWGLHSKNDATDMAARYGCSAPFWAWSWSSLSLIMVSWAMWFVWFRGT